MDAFESWLQLWVVWLVGGLITPGLINVDDRKGSCLWAYVPCVMGLKLQAATGNCCRQVAAVFGLEVPIITNRCVCLCWWLLVDLVL